MKYYKEIQIPNDGKALPNFPQKCPVCDAEVKHERKSPYTFNCEIHYECGGSYQYKSQIQNHTEKFWGSCIKDSE